METILTGKASIQDLRKKMALIRRQGGTVRTNYFNQCADVTELLSYWETDKAIAFEWQDHEIARIYFYGVDLASLSKVLSCPSPRSVVDFITKEKSEMSQLFLDTGYRLHLEYGRFCVQTRSAEAQEVYDTICNDEVLKKEIFENKYGQRAEVSDAEEIDRQLREEFDPYEAHFYSLETLREHIRRGWVWIAKENGKIMAANLFEIQGCKAYGAYLYNRGGVDMMCSLLARTDEYVATLGVSYTYCWMRLSNRRIIRYNMKYNGYVPDGVYDMIYVKE